MKRVSFDVARAELDRARRKLEEMRLARSQRELANRWMEFLNVSNLVFARLANGAKTGPAKGWFDQIKNNRSTDELLQYVHQARHAHEHGIDPIAKVQPHSLKLEGKNVTIKGLKISKGRIEAEHYEGSLSVGFNPAGVVLLPVTNRGQRYNPPKTHRGKPWSKADPVSVAEAQVDYLDDILGEAERFIIDTVGSS